jgi:hypothetical protein
MAAMLDLINKSHAAILPRGEHEEKWRTNAVSQSDLQRQIDEVRKAFGDTYSPKDALRFMQERLDRIEGRLPAKPAS